jgi:hypothetical protein
MGGRGPRSGAKGGRDGAMLGGDWPGQRNPYLSPNFDLLRGMGDGRRARTSRDGGWARVGLLAERRVWSGRETVVENGGKRAIPGAG